MTETTNIDDLFDDPPAPTRAPEPPADKPKADPKPRARTPKPKAKAPAEPIDTAVNIRKLDWECECGNTNTHDLQMCGKCRLHRYR